MTGGPRHLILRGHALPAEGQGAQHPQPDLGAGSRAQPETGTHAPGRRGTIRRPLCGIIRTRERAKMVELGKPDGEIWLVDCLMHMASSDAHSLPWTAPSPRLRRAHQLPNMGQHMARVIRLRDKPASRRHFMTCRAPLP